MRKAFVLFAFAVLVAALVAGPALAAGKTVVLTIPDMDCGSKIMQVTWLLQDSEGITRAEVDMVDPIATITFDDTKTSLESIKAGMAAEGFPISHVDPVE